MGPCGELLGDAPTTKLACLRLESCPEWTLGPCKLYSVLSLQVSPVWGLGSHGVMLYAYAPHPVGARVSLWGDNIRQHQSPQTQTSFLTAELCSFNCCMQETLDCKSPSPARGRWPLLRHPQIKRQLRVFPSVILPTLHRPIIRTTNNSDGTSLCPSITYLFFLILCK